LEGAADHGLGLEMQRYHSIPLGVVERPIDPLQAQDVLRALLTDAVEKRLMGNRRFGFMLSGGLDRWFFLIN
jgi:asparagine synthetase B (glutamine-hydrolysing)